MLASLDLNKKSSNDELDDWQFNAEVVNIDEKVNEVISKDPDSKASTLSITTEKFDTTSMLFKQDKAGDLIFCLSVDGSKHSDTAFNILSEEFFKPNCKLLLVHIYNEKMNHLYNYSNKKETVINTYANKIHKYGKDVNFIVEDRNPKMNHALEQVIHIAEHFKANFNICGYYGIKGPKEDNKELSKGINYLLGFSKIPSIIIKEAVIRKERSSRGYNWLIIFDKQYNNAMKCFDTFLPLIDKENDFVFGLTLIPGSVNANDDMKDDFMKIVNRNNIKNYEYDCNTYSKPPSTLINEKINFGTVIYDFVVFYNNREKHRNEGANSDVINIVTKSNCSICFYNF